MGSSLIKAVKYWLKIYIFIIYKTFMLIKKIFRSRNSINFHFCKLSARRPSRSWFCSLRCKFLPLSWSPLHSSFSIPWTNIFHLNLTQTSPSWCTQRDQSCWEKSSKDVAEFYCKMSANLQSTLASQAQFQAHKTCSEFHKIHLKFPHRNSQFSPRCTRHFDVWISSEVHFGLLHLLMFLT